jgi:molecular chaperone GrpE
MSESTKQQEEKKALIDVEQELKKLQQYIEEEKKRNEEITVKLKYLQADFENYRKRIDREIKEIEEFSNYNLIKKILPSLDELEIAIRIAEERNEKTSLLEGVKMAYKNLLSALESEGLRRIEALGKEFNPNLHEAVEKVQGNGEKDIVIDEIRAGYLYKEHVIRPSLVKVELARRGDKS